jgi:hypothetical protein
MKEKPHSQDPQFVAKNLSRPKTLDLRLAASAQDLRSEVIRAFNLAKSSGRELNATFIPSPS